MYPSIAIQIFTMNVCFLNPISKSKWWLLSYRGRMDFRLRVGGNIFAIFLIKLLYLKRFLFSGTSRVDFVNIFSFSIVGKSSVASVSSSLPSYKKRSKEKNWISHCWHSGVFMTDK